MITLLLLACMDDFPSTFIFVMRVRCFFIAMKCVHKYILNEEKINKRKKWTRCVCVYAATLFTIPCPHLALSLAHFLSLSPERFNEAWLLNPRTAYRTRTCTHTPQVLPASISAAPSTAATSRHRLSANTHLILPVPRCVCECVHVRAQRWWHCFISPPSSSLICRLFDRPLTLCSLSLSPGRLSVRPPGKVGGRSGNLLGILRQLCVW